MFKNSFDFRTLKPKGHLTGKFLVASPFAGLNSVFDRSLIYIIDHSNKGAIGLMVNYTLQIEDMPYKVLLDMLYKKETKQEELTLSSIPILLGGPVELERGFIVHSPEYQDDLVLLNQDVAVSCSSDTLKHILNGSGPRQSMLVMGYTSWTVGQLEDEVKRNMWIVSNADSELIFGQQHKDKWSQALKQAGIDQSLFCHYTGNA